MVRLDKNFYWNSIKTNRNSGQNIKFLFIFEIYLLSNQIDCQLRGIESFKQRFALKVNSWSVTQILNNLKHILKISATLGLIPCATLSSVLDVNTVVTKLCRINISVYTSLFILDYSSVI